MYQHCKYDNATYPSLLQLLPIPMGVRSEINMDFIEGLSKSHGKEVIKFLVDEVCSLF